MLKYWDLNSHITHHVPVAGFGDDAGSAVMTITSTSNAIFAALSSTKATAGPSGSFTFDVLSRKKGSANGNRHYLQHDKIYYITIL